MPELDLPPTWPPAYPRHRPVSRANSNEFDRLATTRHDIPSLVLMEHASCGIAHLAARLAPPGSTVAVLAGPGNNGGDGYGAARFLRSWGWPVEVYSCCPRPPRSGDAALQYVLAAADGPIVDAWEHPEAVWLALERRGGLVLDALFGVNLDGSRPLEAPFRGWIEALNASRTVRLSVDVPSGMDADTGSPCPVCVQAHVTAAMAAPKLGFELNPGPCGRIVEVDIGLPRALHGPYCL